MSGKYLIIAAGGTGGHMFPAQALAEALLADGWRVALFTDARGARYADGFPKSVERRVLTSATPARGGVIAKLWLPFALGLGIASATMVMLRDRPTHVVGFGGYPTIPALSAAFLLRIKRVIHEQNGCLGRVNRVFAKIVDQIACGTWPTIMPKGVHGEHVGNPVRDQVLERKGAPYIAPGNYPLSVVVIGGSQGARILSDVLPQAIMLLPDELRARLRITQQARPEDMERVSDAYAQVSIQSEIAPFFDDIPRRLSEAQLVISRAGASSLADIGVIGRPALLIPFAAAMDDHQTMNAQAAVAAGGALMLSEADFTPSQAAEIITEILTNPDRASQMAQAALAASRPDATARLMNLITAPNKAQSE